MDEQRKLPILRTAIASWRLLLLRPQAALLTMVITVLWLHAALGAATILSMTPGPLVPGSDRDIQAVSPVPLAVSGVFALSGWLVLAALIIVFWARASARAPAVAVLSHRRPLARAVGQSALVLVVLGMLWIVSIMLFGLPFGARPMMVTVNVMPTEVIPEQTAGWVLDPKLLLILGTCVVAAFVPVRLALGLPAVAQGSTFDIRSVWALGSGNGWRLLATVLVVMFPVWLAGMVLDPPYAPPGERDWIWWTRNELDRSLNGLLFALAGIVLALCNRALSAPPTDTDGKRP